MLTLESSSSLYLEIGMDSLDDLIDVRLGRPTRLPHLQSSLEAPADVQSPSARVQVFRAMKRAPPEERERLRREMAESSGGHASGRPSLKAVHLFSAEEIKSLFSDVVEGLAFLVRASHPQLRLGNDELLHSTTGQFYTLT